ncbi:Hypothetical protein IALB_0097 [Ignavibacterium album JCM 16511]|uniref:Uncharacterized protein n=1 Tax=Ignavibacterium album (strain DSM 19864 / JCM 16511 / NBRC 101810 / Mat9-16) TaxID=945713 RepID=I0AFQ4_IGNAJ|nr:MULTISPECIES: hypothetical protein [Ignavibacterium]AFH47811.1 Hypothetical protein IALB_0097 [Ignavibacterium album JCM 16511]BDQ03513.1 MAG: hypothetical protein KatS3mg037_2088 [Ignavibacterium sp.]
MVSLAVKSHWKLALRALKRAIKVTIQELNQIRKSRKYHNKIIDDLDRRRKFFELEKSING